MLRKYGMDGSAQVPDALAVDDAQLENAALATGGDIIRNEIFDVFGFERVQIQDPVYREIDRLVHDREAGSVGVDQYLAQNPPGSEPGECRGSVGERKRRIDDRFELARGCPLER